MELGICLPHHRPLADPVLIATAAQRIEQLGFASVWLSDHIALPNTPAFAPRRVFYEPLILAGYLAAATTRVRIGFSVLVVPYRNPVVTAKQLATIDQLAGGRLVLGVGVGWVAEEFALLDVPFADRGPRTDEYLQAMRELWASDSPTFAGERVQVENITFWPKPHQRSGPPLLVAGMSRPAIRRAAALGDGWHPIEMPLAELPAAIAMYRAACARAGRPQDLPVVYRAPVRLGTNADATRPPFHGTLAELRDDLAALAAAGVSELVLDPAVPGVEAGADWLSTLEELSALLPAGA